LFGLTWKNNLKEVDEGLGVGAMWIVKEQNCKGGENWGKGKGKKKKDF